MLLAWLLWPVDLLCVDIEGWGSIWLPLREGQKLQLTWMHSVSDIPIREVFTVENHRLILMETHNQWFAAGLGEIAGRGRTIAEKNHALAIVDINEPSNGMILRIGSRGIHHTIKVGDISCDLSSFAPHKRAWFSVRLAPRLWYWLGNHCSSRRRQ